ncbi:MAG: Na+/H+ antiporter NhaC family protein [Provencibacterium sp.]|nr:Na+/H+ antiporter NhaC family protein [Provencibacterium sp.]
MDAIQVGFLSILPPVIAIGLALVTKEVISSLIIGILSGTFIYSAYTASGVLGVLVKTFSTTTGLMAAKLGDNAAIILFLALLGALVAVITMAGGSKAYGDWAVSKLSSRVGAQLATSALGVLIFIDDYFNCLTIGTVMRPVTDKHRISHAKLAYIIDATAAPICIIAPVSSWAASVISQMDGTGLDGMSAFMQTIPYNLYALLTIMMVVVLSVSKLEFGPMARFEKNALEKGDLDSSVGGSAESAADELDTIAVSPRGKVIDLIIPIIALIIFSILSMLYIGGYFEGGMTLADGFGNTDAGPALALAGLGALIVAFFLFVPRRVLSFKRFMAGIGVGVKSMVPAFIILTLAWTISGVCRDLLSTGEYVGNLVASSNMPLALIPVIVFIVAGFLSFSMGTSWGTFGILIPIIALVCERVAPELTIISLAATLAGSVFGDHCSPISDTTILSSTGANCDHINHVASQIPYSITVAACCAVGYIVAGFTKNLFLTLLVSFGLLAAALVLLHRFYLPKEPASGKNRA